MKLSEETKILYSKRDRDIVLLAKQGIQFAEIGRQFNMTRERIRQIIKLQGYTDKNLPRKFVRTYKIYKCLQCANRIVVTGLTTDSARLFCDWECMGKFYRKNGIKDIAPRSLAPSNFGKKLYRKIYLGKVEGKIRYEYEHRLVIEEYIGRRLRKNEHIHHINGNGLDNRLENLQLLSGKKHSKLTLNQFHKSMESMIQPILIDEFHVIEIIY